MATEKQIAANRANSLLSSGPRTPEGKAKSSMNGIRHGLLARTVVINGESEDRFNLLFEALLDEHEPATTSEYLVVESLAVAYWEKRRLWSFSRNFINDQAAKRENTNPIDNGLSAHEAAPDAPQAPVDPALLNSRAFRTLSDESRVLDVKLRLEAAYDRQANRALNYLKEARQKRNLQTEANLEAPSDIKI